MSESLSHEAEFWGNCANTWGEEIKQEQYARRMGLTEFGPWPHLELAGRSVLDLGGGPVSMLLKTVNGGALTVVDPCRYPHWVDLRYKVAGIHWLRMPAERFEAALQYDECWIYNVLQHVVDPERVISVARDSARVLRIFEWVGIPADELHPHRLDPKLLNEWCGTEGILEYGVNRAWGENWPAWSWSAIIRQ